MLYIKLIYARIWCWFHKGTYVTLSRLNSFDGDVVAITATNDDDRTVKIFWLNKKIR